MSSTNKWDHLSDTELNNKLLENGFANTPVTETTRPLLIRKLFKYLKNEKLKKKKMENSDFVFYSKKMRSALDLGIPHMETTQNALSHAIDNNIHAINFKNSSTFWNYNKKLDGSDSNVQNLKSRMYAPQLEISPDFEKETERYGGKTTYTYRKIPICPIDMAAFSKPNGNSILYGTAPDGGVVNRLLSFRDSTIQKKVNSKESFSVHVSRATGRNKQLHRHTFSDFRSFFKRSDSNQLIPHCLMCTFTIFLAAITFVYLVKKNDWNPLDENIVKYRLCAHNEKALHTTAQFNNACISREHLKDALEINKDLFSKLNVRSVIYHCSNTNTSPILQVSEFMKELSSKSNNYISKLQVKIFGAIYLISQNPQWMIKVKSSNLATKNQNSYYNFENLSFELMQPNLPFKCRITKILTRFLSIVAWIILIISSCFIIFYIRKQYQIRKKQQLRSTDQFKKEIIKELIQSSLQSENTEVVIKELEDKLVPLSKRSKLRASWINALKILEENDKRILFGMIIRNGEQFRTMTWNSCNGYNDLKITKKWQSPAFDNSNKITNPPTSCLKIRHMFDTIEVDHPNLKQLIVEAIFEKVDSRCNIRDIQLDTQSCCVYLRCASEADAGMVHNKINGWWFDKRLISIKFLRLERYLSRFPKPSEPFNFYIPKIDKI